jgi:RNA polymerase sigma factor (sigma-70 family)
MDATMTTPTDGPLTASAVRAALRTSPPTPAPDHPAGRIDDVVVVVDHSLTFSAFYRDRWSPVARGLALTLGDADLAAEATDEAMARAYPRWATLQAYDNPAGWVYRVGLNWARSHRRRIARMIPFVHHDTAELGSVSDPSITVALMELPLRQRSVVVCRLLLDWSVEDTAAALDISPGTVKSRLHRALQTLESTLSHLR